MSRLRKIFKRLTKPSRHNQESSIEVEKNARGISLKISFQIDKNIALIQQIFSHSIDLQFAKFETYSGVKVMLVFLGEIVDKSALDNDVIKSIMKKSEDVYRESDKYSVEEIKKMITVTDLKEVGLIDEVIDAILYGSSVLFFEGQNVAFVINKSKWQVRQIEEPPSESVIKGPKEGFVESISVNRSMIRRKIKSENLVFEKFTVGKKTNTELNITYVIDTVNQEVLTEVRERINKIDVNAILDAGNVEELIEDSIISPIATIGNTQKPDMLAAKILEGRVGILCDGSPHVLTVPHVFAETIHSPEDYYIRPYIASFLRVIRMAALIICITLPALYVALTTFHQDMIPSVLLRTMKGASEGIPLPAAAEAILMTIFFEFLKESGTRLPKAVGSAISIVGALVLGEAGVQAGIVSAPMVLITAFTAVCSFIVNPLNEMITLYRMILLILAGILGLYGFTVGIFMMILHVVSLRSFGVPYMSPVVPIQAKGLKDYIFRFPIKEIYNSPFFSEDKNSKGK